MSAPRDPADPPSLPSAERADPPPPEPAPPLADEPLDVVAPEHDATDLPQARRPLEAVAPAAEEEDVDDDPTVRFDPLQARELAASLNEKPRAPAEAPEVPVEPAPPPVPEPPPRALEEIPVPTSGRKQRRTISDEIDDDPETLARALAVAPDAGGAPTAVPVTDPLGEIEPLEELDPIDGSPIPIVRDTPAPAPSLPPIDLQQLERPKEPETPSGPDVRKLAPVLVGVMVVLMLLVVLASLM